MGEQPRKAGRALQGPGKLYLHCKELRNSFECSLLCELSCSSFEAFTNMWTVGTNRTSKFELYSLSDWRVHIREKKKQEKQGKY